MKYVILFFFAFLTVANEASAQDFQETIPSPFFTSSSPMGSRRGARSRFLTPDRMQYYKPKAIQLTVVSGSMYQSDMYWMSSMTTQSYNHGKIGRFYLWDVQGNLRESKMFFDIAGKNKRGLKIVFSKFRFGL